MSAPRKLLRAAAAMLCVALSLVFAGASAASALDRVQHSSEAAGPHGHLAFSDFVYGDHHAEHVLDAGERDIDQNAAPGHHHHADGPVGVLPAPVAGRGDAAPGAARLALERESLATGLRPGGLERPPRRAEDPV